MTTDLIKALASYNTWANEQTQLECAMLSNEQAHKNVGAFFWNALVAGLHIPRHFFGQ